MSCCACFVAFAIYWVITFAIRLFFPLPFPFNFLVGVVVAVISWYAVKDKF